MVSQIRCEHAPCSLPYSCNCSRRTPDEAMPDLRQVGPYKRPDTRSAIWRHSASCGGASIRHRTAGLGSAPWYLTRSSALLTYHGLAPGDPRDKGRESARGYRAGRFPLRRREEAGHGGFTGPGSTMRRGCSLISPSTAAEKACLALEVIRGTPTTLALLARRAGREAKTVKIGTAAGKRRRIPPLPPSHPARLQPPRQAALFRRLAGCRAPATGPRWCWWARPAAGRRRLLLQRLRQMPGRVAYVTESKWLAETSRAPLRRLRRRPRRSGGRLPQLSAAPRDRGIARRAGR